MWFNLVFPPKFSKGLYRLQAKEKTKAWLFLVSSSNWKKSFPAVRTGVPPNPPTHAPGTQTNTNTKAVVKGRFG